MINVIVSAVLDNKMKAKLLTTKTVRPLRGRLLWSHPCSWVCVRRS